MKTAVLALTKNGSELAYQLGRQIGADIYLKPEFANFEARVYVMDGGLTEFVGRIFASYDRFVFIMACGIAVRTISPYLKNKAEDPAVVVLDEKGSFAVSLLSGHMGGANLLAKEVALLTGGTAVITTATDVNGVIAFDMVAKENDCEIENIGILKFISSRMVNGECVGLYCDTEIAGDIPDNIVKLSDIQSNSLGYMVLISNRIFAQQNNETMLILRPKNLILGIGCKKGILKDEIKGAFEHFLKVNNRSVLSLKHIATIDIKKDEEGILDFCSLSELELKIVSSEKIAEVENSYTCSEFVKKSVKVASVAEPCAVLSGSKARLICKKTVYKGITLALAEEESEIHL